MSFKNYNKERLKKHNEEIGYLYERGNKLLLLKTLKKQELNITDDTFILDEFKDTSVKVLIHCASIEPMDDILACIKSIKRFQWKRLIIEIYVVEELVDMREIAKMTNGMDIKLLKMNNYGLDIASFVIGLKDCQEDIIMKMHTKTIVEWRKNMFMIFEPVLLYNSIKLLKNQNVGMIGDRKSLRYQVRDWDIDRRIINKTMEKYSEFKKLCDTLKIQCNESLYVNSLFIAGTVFICRREILQQIIDNVDILYSKFNLYNRLRLPGENNNDEIEFLMERLFGYLCIIEKKHLLGISYNAE